MFLQSSILHDYEQFMNVHWSLCLRRFRKNCCSAQLSGEGPYVRGSQIYHLHGAFPNARASILCEVTRGPHRPDGQLERSDTMPFPLFFTGSMKAIGSLSIHWKKITFQRMSADPGMVAHTWKPSTRFSSFGKEMEVWSEWFKLALRKQRQEIHYKVWGQSVIHRKFQTSQGYKVTNTLSQASKQQTHKQAE